jgi:conjugal transfer pilus assembly protein TraU
MKAILLIISIALTISSNAFAKTACHGKFVNPITDICWSCLLPISIGSMHVTSSKHPDTKNPSLPVCICPKNSIPQVGITLGYWEPIGLVDVTRNPFCMVNLGGIELNLGNYGLGTVDTSDPSQGGSFYYAHFYIYPLLYWLSIITDAVCVEQAEFDIAYLTEIDPMWRDDELTFILNPEAILFGNPIAQLSCAADAIAASTGLPIDALFWCAGAQGSMYPLDGFVQEHVGGVQASTLIAERLIFKMHREMLMWETVGENSPKICEKYPSPILPKSRYRYEMTNPKPSSSEPDGCKPFGNTTSIWGAWHEYPYTGEDFGYLIWRKRNCCAGP